MTSWSGGEAAPEERPATSESSALSVSAALGLAKRQLEGISVRVIGEVSELAVNARYKAVYFTVKDKGASMPCMMWNNRYRASGVQLKVGDLVELDGRFTLYAAKGRMNFDVSSVRLAGEGDLRMQVANLAKRLEAEGLMAQARKRPLPGLPSRIGLVTSPRGAAVYDVLRTLRRRYPIAEIVFAGVGVEGAGAPAGIIEGLRAVEAAGPDVILLVRGGGSFEDLMPFNDESLARAIASASMPVVTGIGHEPDTSIADMVSDLRASTPTAAAESVAPSAQELSLALSGMAARLTSAERSRLHASSLRLGALSSLPLFREPMRLFDGDARRLDAIRSSLSSFGRTFPKAFADGVALEAARLEAYSPLSVLSRGYAIATNAKGDVVRTIRAVHVGDAINVRVSDGVMRCDVEGFERVDYSLEVMDDC